MKKLNRKGFTLIELLAVIVILAIVMVVTIPSVINAMNSARSGQLKNAADTVADWLTKNYELSTYSGALGTDPVDPNYNEFLNNTTDKAWTKVENGTSVNKVLTMRSEDLVNAGITDASSNIETALAKLVGNKVCVTLTAKSTGSFNVNGGTNKATSAGCDEVVTS